MGFIRRPDTRVYSDICEILTLIYNQLWVAELFFLVPRHTGLSSTRCSFRRTKDFGYIHCDYLLDWIFSHILALPKVLRGRIVGDWVFHFSMDA